mmetsp:Transcript_4619/g.16399  ORF Transcript_4619/g.16399 Transcript_4619/m.16399 type:complete len:668 (+) Transcript_4619:1125-3128(+)
MPRGFLEELRDAVGAGDEPPVRVFALRSLHLLGRDPARDLRFQRPQREQRGGEVRRDVGEARREVPAPVAEESAVVGVALQHDDVLRAQRVEDVRGEVPQRLRLRPRVVRRDDPRAGGQVRRPPSPHRGDLGVFGLLHDVDGAPDVFVHRVRDERRVALDVKRHARVFKRRGGIRTVAGTRTVAVVARRGRRGPPPRAHDSVREREVAHELEPGVVDDDPDVRDVASQQKRRRLARVVVKKLLLPQSAHRLVQRVRRPPPRVAAAALGPDRQVHPVPPQRHEREELQRRNALVQVLRSGGFRERVESRCQRRRRVRARGQPGVLIRGKRVVQRERAVAEVPERLEDAPVEVKLHDEPRGAQQRRSEMGREDTLVPTLDVRAAVVAHRANLRVGGDRQLRLERLQRGRRDTRLLQRVLVIADDARQDVLAQAPVHGVVRPRALLVADDGIRQFPVRDERRARRVRDAVRAVRRAQRHEDLLRSRRRRRRDDARPRDAVRVRRGVEGFRVRVRVRQRGRRERHGVGVREERRRLVQRALFRLSRELLVHRGRRVLLPRCRRLRVFLFRVFLLRVRRLRLRRLHRGGLRLGRARLRLRGAALLLGHLFQSLLAQTLAADDERDERTRRRGEEARARERRDARGRRARDERGRREDHPAQATAPRGLIGAE